MHQQQAAAPTIALSDPNPQYSEPTSIMQSAPVVGTNTAVEAQARYQAGDKHPLTSDSESETSPPRKL